MSERPNEPVAPKEAGFRAAAIAAILLCAAATFATANCGPLYGPAVFVAGVMVLCFIVLPVLAVVGVLASVVVRAAPRAGIRRIWNAVLYGAFAVLAAALATASVWVVVAPGLWCELF